MENPKREQWSSKMGFILAAAGSAIGLGNIWKFPYIAGENGGAAFLFIYLICILSIGLPVLIAEVLIGRTTQRNPVGAFKKLTNNKFWSYVGKMGIITAFIILSFYSVVAGWAIGYIVESAKGAFQSFKEPAQAGEYFNSLLLQPEWNLFYLLVFILMSMFFVYFGVQKGIEKGSKIMMPLLFILLIILMIRGITLEGANEGLKFFFHPEWSKITSQTILLALGHAFFTLSLGMGVIMTYGSYMSNNDSIPGTSLSIIILDTVISVVAGVMIFTTVFAFGQDPAQGPGLIFHVIPVVFNQMPGGIFFAILFFILLALAALTSSISLIEVVVAYFVDEKKWKRQKAVIFTGVVGTLLAIPCSLSYNLMSEVKLFDSNFFDTLDFLASNILLPLGGFLLAIFVGYVWGLDKAVENLKIGSEKFFEKYPVSLFLWKIFIKYLAPLLMFFVLLDTVGILKVVKNLFVE